MSRCSKPGCAKQARKGQRYCKPHHAEASRAWRARRSAILKRLEEHGR